MKIFLIFLIPSFLTCSAQKVTPLSISKEYLHISHTRTDKNPHLDSIVESADYNKYDMLLLGGDLAISTSINEKAISHVDSIFNLGNPNTLWSLGNHDYKNLVRVKEYTKRAPYYSYNKNGITFIVLDTQDSLSNIVGEQKKFFNSVIDTIQQSSHLIVLHHKLIWMYGNSQLEPRINKEANGNLGDCFYCTNPNNFYSDIYPKLLKIKQKGIEVICLGGDIGFKTKEFDYTTPEGIHFLASGIEHGDNKTNKALLFKHNVLTKHLEWEFIPLTNL
jgi:hypothetical protein